MIEERVHGVKRKLSDADGDLQTRCYQRQTIFDISVCKLRKNYCNGEPLLSKTVLIANTIRLIEEDIEEERAQIKHLLCDAPCSSHSTDSLGARMIVSHNGPLLQNKSREALNKPMDLLHFEEEMNLLGDKIVRELGLDYCKDYEERRKQHTSENTDTMTDSNNNASSEKASDLEREIVSCSSLLGLELTDELEFGDVDLSLYDFDTCNAAGLPVEVEELCAAWGLSNSLTARCGESMKRERTNENFDELDQVMQILVGS